MIDLFEKEQKILDSAINRANALRDGALCDNDEFISLAKEYGSLLKQLRRLTRISDKTTTNMNLSNSELLDKAHYDSLTGIYNRLFLEESLKRIARSLSRSGAPLSILLLDVDFFGSYNDTYGRKKGDACLKSITSALNDSVFRADDLVARFGGDEFVVVLPTIEEKGAHVIAKRIIDNIRAENILHEKSDAAKYVTVSIGVVTDTAGRKQNADDYIKRAVEALNMSRQSGGNKYTFVNFND